MPRLSLPRLTLEALCCASIAAFCAMPAASAPPPAAPHDPIEGGWLGTGGPPEDRVETGLEIARNAQGELKAFLYRPVINTYGAELPGTVRREGDHYVLTEVGLTLVLAGDTLEVRRADPPVVNVLARTDRLPREEPLPELPPAPAPKWQVKLGGAIYAPVTIFAGVAYAGTSGGALNAVSLDDGRFLWGFAAGRPIHGQSLATDGAVYFVCDNGYLFKLDRETGKELWRYDLGDAQVPRITQIREVYGYDYRASRPVLADGRLYVGAADGGFHAVDAASGKRVWRFAGKGKQRADALVHGAMVVFGGWDGVLHALDRATGRELWQQRLADEITSAPAIAGDRLIVGSRGSLLYALKPDTGEVLWKLSFWGSWVESTATIADGLVYIGSSDLRRVSCIDPADGHVVWRTDVFGSPWGQVAVDGDRVYAGAEGNSPYPVRMLGSLTALDRRSGRIVWRWAAPELPGVVQNGFAAGPALAGDTLVIGGLDGTLYAFPVR